MEKSEAIETEELVEAMCEVLAALPDTVVRHLEREPNLGGRGRPDALVDISIRGHDFQLVVEAKKELFPRDIHHNIWQLQTYSESRQLAGEQVPMLLARAISKGARDILQTEQVGYFDSGGSLFLPSKTAFVLIDRATPKKARRRLDSIFRGKRAQVLQAIIAAWPDWVSVKELAEKSGASPATTSETLTEMERRDWLEVEGAGPAKLRRLKGRGPVLDEWSRIVANQKRPKLERYYVPASNSENLARRLDHACRETGAPYAVTAEAAAQAYAPYLTNISQLKCRIRKGRAQTEALRLLDARPVSEGWNLGIIDSPASQDVAIGEEISGICYAPCVQVYLDLLQGSGRSKEMADHLRAERLDA